MMGSAVDAYLVSDQSQLQPGDFIAADWSRGPSGIFTGPDGTIDHMMIVTEAREGGRAYLSYHTSDKRNESFDAIRLLNRYTRSGKYYYIKVRR
jgi:hypothetical protein